MEKLIRYLGALDWLVAGLTLATGVVMQNGWVIAAGCLGLFTAYLQPAKRFQAYLGKKLLKKGNKAGASTARVLEDEAFYAAALAPVELPEPTPALPPRTYASTVAGYKGTYLSGNRHNKLKVAHLNLFSEKKLPQYF